MVPLLAQSQKGRRNVFTVTCTITYSSFRMFAPLCVKQVSGGCLDCKEPSLVEKSACPVTPPFVVWSLRQLCLSTIFKPTTLVTVKFRLFLTRSMFAAKTCMDTTELLSITSVQGNITARSMRMGMTVTVRAKSRSNIIAMVIATWSS